MFRRALLILVAWIAATGSSNPARAQQILIAGDAGGNVSVRDLSGVPLFVPTSVFPNSIGRLELVDLETDGMPELLVTPYDADLPACCFDLPALTLRWCTSHATRIPMYGHEALGARTYLGDFDGDGGMELLIPFMGDTGNSTLYQIFSAADGVRECAFDEQMLNYLGAAYWDPIDSTWKLAAEKAPNGFTHALYKYSVAGCPDQHECANTSVNMWKMGAIGSSMCDGQPRIWGGWYGRTLWVTDRDCNTLWQKSFGGSYEAEAVYGGDLRGDGVEALLIGGTYGTNHVRLDAVALCDGATLWTYDDDEAHWSVQVMAAEDVNGDGAKEVFVRTHGNETYPPKVVAIDGLNGTHLWSVAYSNDTWMVVHGRLADVDGNGVPELLVIVNNTIEARNALNGALVRTYEFDSDVTAFDVAIIPPAPEIVTHPSSILLPEGGQLVQFSVAADGGDSLQVQYQWRRDGVDLADDSHVDGANDAQVTIFAGFRDIGLYDCVVTNAGRHAISHTAVLGIRTSCRGDLNVDSVVDFRDINRFTRKYKGRTITSWSCRTGSSTTASASNHSAP